MRRFNLAGFFFLFFFLIFEFRGIIISRFSLNTTFCGILASRFYQNTLNKICDILVLRKCSKLNFLCAWVSNIAGISGKAWNLNARLKTFLSFFTPYWFTEVLKTPKKIISSSKIFSTSSSESTTGLINPRTWRSSSNVLHDRIKS